MLITDNEQYNNLLKEWEDLYNKTYGLNYYGKFPIYISDNYIEDASILSIDEKEKNNIIYKASPNGFTLFPYKERKEPCIVISEKCMENSISTKDLNVNILNSTFFHEYSHAIDFHTFFQRTQWDYS